MLCSQIHCGALPPVPLITGPDRMSFARKQRLRTITAPFPRCPSALLARTRVVLYRVDVRTGPQAKRVSEGSLPTLAVQHLLRASVLLKALAQELLVQVPVHCLHGAPQTGKERTALLELDRGVLQEKLLEASLKPFHHVEVRAALGVLVKDGEALLGCSGNRFLVHESQNCGEGG